jgi:hypothetical protein
MAMNLGLQMLIGYVIIGIGVNSRLLTQSVTKQMATPSNLECANQQAVLISATKRIDE